MINDTSMLMVDNTGDESNITDIRSVEEQQFLKQAEPKLEALEEIRKVKLKIYEFRKKLAIPAALLITPFLGYIDWILLLWQRGADDKAAGLSAAFLGLLYWWVTQPKRQYAREYKVQILPGLVKIFGNFQYHVDGKIRMEQLNGSKIVPSHNIYNAEDYFRGDYKGVGMEFVEMELKKRTGSGKNRRTVTVFKGLAVLLDMKHKKFLGHTIMDRNSSKVGQWFKEKSHDLERANMVDPEFEKIFDVYTNDQVEARYIIDPLMIERLKGLYMEYEGEKMAVSFYDSKMLVMIASKHNHFEPASLYTPATDPQSILSMKREIGEILSLVDKLSLYDSRKVRAA
jgi:hypothetical protein